MHDNVHVTIIGGGLAGCEAAWQAAQRGCAVTLREMKPQRFSPAHRSEQLAELVCSNSLKAASLDNAAGLLKEELRRCGSLIMQQADRARVPAGGALAVDRDLFSRGITRALADHPAVRIVRQEVTELPAGGCVIVATGPLTSDAFAERLRELTGAELLFFHDAISPIIEADSIDHSRVFRASRYGKADPDYLNCPLTQEQYDAFVDALLAADKVPLRDYETLIPFEGCMPIEVMAERGRQTLAHGPMKPVGLVDPATGAQPYAAVQLRQENQAATLYNMVGFQTRLKWPEQRRVFSMLPGLERASFVRYGSLHRNTFIHAPQLLLQTLQLRQEPRIFFAGQITGVEGYCEATAMGLVAGMQAARYARGLNPVSPPPTSMIGGLLAYITGRHIREFQPMNANFGLLPELPGKTAKKDRKRRYAERALEDISAWISAVDADARRYGGQSAHTERNASVER